MITTGVPHSALSNSHSASGTCMRMQPCEAEYPIEASSGVPWMPTYGAVSPIQRVPSGFPGPGGIGFAPSAHADPAGGYHHGSNCLLMTSYLPSGVGYSDRPVATWKVRISLVLAPTL